MKSEILSKIFILLIFLFIAVASCHRGHETENIASKPGMKEMTELNRYLVQKDREIIENYIERKNLRMKESPTGLWYSIVKEGTGCFIEDNDKIIMNYECALLDGTKCYSSDVLGSKEIILGKSNLEQGLNEGIRLLRPGAEAVFIIPPFLAYGLIGDGKKIPPRAIIIYNIKILPGK